MRRRRRRGWCNVAIYFACWPLAGLPPVLAQAAFLYCTPFITGLMLKWGLSTTSISDVQVGGDSWIELLLMLVVFSIIGGSAWWWRFPSRG